MKTRYSLLLLLFISLGLEAQYVFTMEEDLPVLPARDQHRTGTCWSYSTTSFLEAELIRTGKGEHALSEMFFVHKAYEMKAEKFVRMHGETNFGSGGLSMDVIRILKDEGMVPREAYSGITYGGSLPVHGEMDGQLRSYVESLIRNKKPSPVWMEGFGGILDAYLGEIPTDFEYQGASYSPASFAEAMELDPDDYVAIGSYTHHPFYTSFPLEIPDNWLWSEICNVPLDEMLEVLGYALKQGYTVLWDGDVGEMGYAHGSGLALLPDYDADSLDEEQQEEWKALSDREKGKQFYDFFPTVKEAEVDQAKRQEWFDNFTTTDIHLQHVCGLAADQDGKRFFKVKNSYGAEDHIYDGFQFFSESYMRGKTIFIMLHKEGIPAATRKRLGL